MDETIKAKLLKAFKLGMTQRDAAGFAGIAPQTVSEILSRGRAAVRETQEGGEREGKGYLKKDYPYIEFLRAVEAAKQSLTADAGKAAQKLLGGAIRVKTITVQTFALAQGGEDDDGGMKMVMVKEERREEREQLPPDSAMARFVLGQRWGKQPETITDETEEEDGGGFSPATAEQLMQARAKQAIEALHLFDGLEEGGVGDDPEEDEGEGGDA